MIPLIKEVIVPLLSYSSEPNLTQSDNQAVKGFLLSVKLNPDLVTVRKIEVPSLCNFPEEMKCKFKNCSSNKNFLTFRKCVLKTTKSICDKKVEKIMMVFLAAMTSCKKSLRSSLTSY